jgi:carboxyl-terminal processing protease
VKRTFPYFARAARRTFLFVVLSLVAFSCTAARPRSLKPEERQEVFEAAWTAIRDRHFDPNLGGVDWNAVREKTAPRVAAAANDDELLNILSNMTQALGHSHVGVLPPDPEARSSASHRHADGDAPRDPGDSAAATPPSHSGTTGLWTRWIDGHLYIVRVAEGSDAARKNVHIGDEVLRVAGKVPAELVETMRREGSRRAESVLPYAIEQMFSGPVGTTVPLEWKDPAGRTASAEIVREKPAIDPVSIGYLGSLGGEFEARQLRDKILYIRFTTCTFQMQERVATQLQQHLDAAGVVLDLRGNPGGIGAVAMGVARLFFEKELTLGDMHMRGGNTMHFLANPPEKPFPGPLVVLTDESTASTAEILAAGLQVGGRARIVGTTTMGAALPSTVIELPHRWRLMTPIADFISKDGRSIEGKGVVPDVPVTPRAEDYKNGVDRALATALEEIPRAPLASNAHYDAPRNETAVATDRPPAEASPEVVALIDRMIDASGGAEIFRNMKTMHSVSTMSVMGTPIQMDGYFAAPGKIYIKSSSELAGETIQVFDGVNGWMHSPATGLRAIQGAELAALKRDIRADRLARWRQLWKKVEIAERVRKKERDGIVLLFMPHEGEGFPQRVTVDAAKALPYRIVTKSETAMGTVEATTDVLEYRNFSGIVMPSKLQIQLSGLTVDSVTEQVELNVPVDDSLFTQPKATKKSAKSKPAGK